MSGSGRIVLCAYLFAREQGLAEIGVQHLPAELTPRLQYKRRATVRRIASL